MPTPVFPLTPWYSVKYSPNQFKTLISKGEGGKERRRSKVSTTGRSISFPLNYLSAADLATLYAFYVARLGAYQAFNIVLNGETILVRFANDSLSWDWFKKNWYNSSITLQEVVA